MAKALFITTNFGVETDELLKVKKQLEEKGLETTVAAEEKGEIKTMVLDKDPGESGEATLTLAEAKADDYDVLVIPGGTINADALRGNKDAISLVKAFADQKKAIGAICHASWIYINADIIKDLALTSVDTIQLDLENAGADWSDVEVKVDDSKGFTSITSRNPGDIDVFTKTIAETVK